MAQIEAIIYIYIRFCVLIFAKNDHTIKSIFCHGTTTHKTGKASIKLLINAIKKFQFHNDCIKTSSFLIKSIINSLSKIDIIAIIIVNQISITFII